MGAAALAGRCSTQSPLKDLSRRVAFWTRLLFAWQAQYTELHEGPVARRVALWTRLLFAWQAQCTEPPEGLLARRVALWTRLLFAWQIRGLVARRVALWTRLLFAFWRAGSRGRGCSLRGRCSTQSFLKDFGAPGRFVERLLFAYTERPEGPVARRVALWRGCLFAWQVQYTELHEGCVARRFVNVAATLFGSTQSLLKDLWRAGSLCGRGCPLRGRRSTQSFMKDLWRVALWTCGLFAWQVQYTEPLEGLVARRVALWTRLLFAWQAQYTELPEGPVARRVALWLGCLFARQVQ